jgi:hypothetical protein
VRIRRVDLVDHFQKRHDGDADEPWCAYGCAASSNTTNTAENSVNATATVYRAVTCACLGAFLFGYHLGVVNGPLQQIAKDLAFAGDVSLQGLVRVKFTSLSAHNRRALMIALPVLCL